MNPDDLYTLKVWMTMVTGRIEYCAIGHEAFCPRTQSTSSTTDTNLPRSGNLALSQSATASMSLASNPPELALDGDETTHWGAGDFPVQWIEVDLGSPATVSEIRLLTSQSPAGNTLHSIKVRGENDNLSEVHQFDQFTSDDEWLIFKPETPLENVQIIRIETLESPSWVSWVEIQVFGTR